MTFREYTDRFCKSDKSKYKSLNCSNTGLTDLDGIHEFINIKMLYCYNNSLKSLDGLQHLRHLTFINCTNNNIDTLDHIKEIATLENIWLVGNPLSKHKIYHAVKDLPCIVMDKEYLKHELFEEKLNRL